MKTTQYFLAMAMIAGLSSSACSGTPDQNGDAAQQAVTQACSQTQQQMDASLEQALLSNSCLQGYEVDATATTCAATNGNVAEWVCTQCTPASEDVKCANESSFAFEVNITVNVKSVSVSGTFSGFAKASFSSTHKNSGLEAIPDAEGDQPAFEYYRSTASASISQDKGFTGTFTAESSIPGVGKVLSINSDLSCHNSVTKAMAQKSNVEEDTCGEKEPCSGPTTGTGSTGTHNDTTSDECREPTGTIGTTNSSEHQTMDASHQGI